MDKSLSPRLVDTRLDVEDAECVGPWDSLESPSDSGEKDRSRLTSRVSRRLGSVRESKASMQKLEEPE